MSCEPGSGDREPHTDAARKINTSTGVHFDVLCRRGDVGPHLKASLDVRLHDATRFSQASVVVVHRCRIRREAEDQQLDTRFVSGSKQKIEEQQRRLGSQRQRAVEDAPFASLKSQTEKYRSLIDGEKKKIRFAWLSVVEEDV